jgi:hypothetical protein
MLPLPIGPEPFSTSPDELVAAVEAVQERIRSFSGGFEQLVRLLQDTQDIIFK